MTLQTILFLVLGAGALFIVMRFGCGTHAMARGHAGHSHGNGPPADDATAVDPVCGMNVDKATASSAVHDGSTYYFCSESCRDKFTASPGQYTAAPANKAHDQTHHHGCC